MIQIFTPSPKSLIDENGNKQNKNPKSIARNHKYNSLALGIAAIIFYAISALIAFWTPLVSQFGSIQWDAATVHFFNLFFSSETWRNGIFPLWTPYIFGGFPQIADLQVAFFYPVNLLISYFAAFTPELMMQQLVLHYFLAGFFAFLLVKHLCKNFWFSLAAGLAYSFGGFMVGHASHVGMQNTAAWLPLIFLLLILTLEKTKIIYAALGGLALGIAILAGHFQTALYIAFAIGFYFIFDIAWLIFNSFELRNIFPPLSQGPVMTKKDLFHLILNKTFLVSIIFIIAFLVSAIQLLPAYELVGQSNRAKISLEISQTESLRPENLRGLISPNYNNVSSEAPLPYKGPWDRTQNYLFISITIIILAAAGLLTGIYKPAGRKMAFFWIILLVLSLFYSFGEFSFLQKYFYRFVPFFDKVRAPANMMLLFDLSIIGLASLFIADAGERFQKLKKRQNIFIKNSSALIGIFALLLISGELYSAVQNNTLLYGRTKPGEIIAAPPIAQRIIEEYSHLNDNAKFKTFKAPGLDTNLTQLLHIFAFDGYNPLSTERYSQYVDAMVKNEKLIDLAGIKYLPCQFIANRAEKLEKIGSLCVNRDYFPFAFFIPDYIVEKNKNAILAKMASVNLKNTIVLEESPEQNYSEKNQKGISLSSNVDKLFITEAKPGFWKITAENSASSFLFFSQTNYPGWTAKIDNSPAKIYQADYLFQSVFVPAGKHEIILQYKSRQLKNGAILSIIGLFAVFVSIAYARFWQKTAKR